jgi:hypothetical protein
MRTFRIVERPDGYALLDDTGAVLAVHPTPRKLSDIAFANDADLCRHEYDLRKAEGLPWT